MGEVYLARDVEISRDVALKVLPSTFSSDKDRLQRRLYPSKRTQASLAVW